MILLLLGLIVNYLVVNHNLSWKEADSKVANFADELNSLIKIGKPFVFKSLGEFVVKENNLVFKPADQQSFLDDSYGLKKFYFPMLKSAKNGIEIQRQPVLSKTGESKANKKQKSLKPIHYLGAVAVIAGLIFLGFQFDLIYFEKQVAIESANVLPVELITKDSSTKTEASVNVNNDHEEIQPEVIDKTEILENIEPEKIDNNADPIIEEKIETVQPITESMNIHVIAGSFSDISNAENYKQNLMASGFDSQIMPAGNGMYRVTVKSFSHKSDAVAELQSLRNSTGNQSLWVLVN